MLPPEPKCRETLSSVLPGAAAIAMLAGFAYQPVGFTLGKLATAVKNPYAAFLSKRCCGMEGAQCYPATFTFEFEGVAAFETEFVPDGLGNDDPPSFIECHR